MKKTIVNPSEYVTNGRPDSFDPTNDSDWYMRLFKLIDRDSEYKKRYAIADCIHTHVRQAASNGNVRMSVQNNINIDKQLDEWIDEFVLGELMWDITPEYDQTQSKIVLDIQSVCVDTAEIGSFMHELGPSGPAGPSRHIDIVAKLDAMVTLSQIGYKSSGVIQVLQNRS